MKLIIHTTVGSQILTQHYYTKPVTDNTQMHASEP